MSLLSQVEMRDFVGYGERPPRFEWPGGKRVALSVVVNYEEGGENCVLDGDKYSEAHSFDCNDMRFASAPGFDTPDDFTLHLRRTLIACAERPCAHRR